MIKRPLCAAAVLYLCVQTILTAGFRAAKDPKPGGMETALGQESKVTLTGTVYKREEKPDYNVLYLKDNHVLLNNQIYQESKILVYIETENRSKNRVGNNYLTEKGKQSESEVKTEDSGQSGSEVKTEDSGQSGRNIKAEQDIQLGNKIQVTGKAEVFESPRNPGNFDQKFYYQKQGIHASVWADSARIKEHRVYHLREGLAVLRAEWKQMLTESLGDYYGNSMSAILLGEKSELDSELKALYQTSGIGHILAISGLHMSFLGIGLYQILRKMGLNFGTAGSIGICFLLGYTLMIGCGVSSLRALVMFIVRMGADITGRDYDMPTSLALAAAVIVAWQPLYLMDAGFLLSFGALLGIVCVNPCLEYWFLSGVKQKKNGRGPCKADGQGQREKKAAGHKERFQAWKKNICASLAINLTLLPVMLYFYFEFPLYSILLNLLVIPLMSLLLGAGAAGSLVTVFIPGIGKLVLTVCKWVLALYEKACQISMALPMSRIVTGQPGKGVVFGYYVLLAGLCAVTFWLRRKEEEAEDGTGEIKNAGFQSGERNNRRGNKENNVSDLEQYRAGKVILKTGAKRVSGSISILGLCFFLCFTCFRGHEQSGKLSVTMLDVGQGDGLFLKGPGGTKYFVDGGSSDVSSVGKYRIEPFLKSQGVSALDYVFISHGDADHMNGIEEMLENQKLGVQIKRLVLPPVEVQDDSLKSLALKAVENGTKVFTIKEGDVLTEEEFTENKPTENELMRAGMKILCKGPLKEYQGEPGNAASMVLEVSFEKFRMLFAGDVEGEGEKLLEESGGLKQYDVLKAAHHGSKNSSSEEFLKQTSPKCTWISAGIDNRYGHPHEETIRKLDEIESKIYGTQECGAVTLVTDGEKAEIKPYYRKATTKQLQDDGG